ncbi:MAG: hypothetical protein Q9165_001689 [Trypethelium subeluteriae]
MSAISNLCRASGVSVLFYDAKYESLAKGTPEWLQDIVLPFTKKDEAIHFHGLAATSEQDVIKTPKIEEKAIAYLFHTSGTSSGLPKPIPQTHRAAAGVLPRLMNSNDNSLAATFTTTPLYHGGIADLFRAWTSGAMIWLFPAHLAPITAPNINQCLSQIKSLGNSRAIPPVKYFSSVPYVLQMLAADPEGLQNLQVMDLVGVGGAALPPSLGDTLVSKDVNLVSRYGSAECGFLLSSHRDYADDKEWQYLRTPSGDEYLEFEPQDDAEETYELVVKPGWPHMAKQNREDGSYATSDLFVKHLTLEGAWRYHSRKDAQLTLVTGKKFDPAPLEADIVAATPLIGEAVVFGNGELYPGALIFRSKQADEIGDEEFLAETCKVVEKLNQESQEHAKLARGMLVPMSSKQSSALQKSSKGTLLRKQAEEKFSDIIRKTYSDAGGDDTYVPDDKIKVKILEAVKSIVRGGEQLTPETDLFSFGMDSAASMQIRSRLRRLLPKSAEELPMTIVEDCGDVDSLSTFIEKSRHGESQSPGNDDDYALMHQLVDRYSTFTAPHPSTDKASQVDETSGKGHVVVLTGATGALGSHVLTQLVASPNIAKIYCLVRGATPHAARERVSKALSQRGLPPLPAPSDQTGDPANEKTVIIPAKLSIPDLGLSSTDYNRLATSTTLILHLAWSVNFRLRLANFEKDSIASVTQLLRLALASPHAVPPAFVFCSSTASVLRYRPADPSPGVTSAVPEEIIQDPAAAAPLGYARSKWVAEHVCARAAQTTRLGERVAVLRVGQLAGDTERGAWNASEAWPLMLRSVVETRALPALREEVLGWLGVDVAAGAMIESAMVVEGEGKQQESKEQSDSKVGAERIRVYHVLNEHLTPTWMDLLGWMKKREKFEVVEAAEWVRKLEGLRETTPEHPALGLLGLWRDAYGDQSGDEHGKQREQKVTVTFVMEESKETAPILKTVRPVDEEYFGKMWEWIKTNM